MKKFLWFLVGMALIISIPIMLFSQRTLPKKTAIQSSEIRKEQEQKPGTAKEAKTPVPDKSSPSSPPPGMKKAP